MGYYLLFFFVTVGAKLLLALVMMYFLLPRERSCTGCDGDTLLLEGSRAVRLGTRLLLGRVQWRWCPRCGWEGMARGADSCKLPAASRPHGRINSSW